MRGAGRDYQLAKVHAERLDIVAINQDGHVVALATSDGGKSDKAFAKEFLGPKYRVEIMPVGEACDRHVKYLKSLASAK